MSTEQPTPQSPATGEHPAPATGGHDRSPRSGDPLRGSRASGTWIAVLALVVLLILLAIFVLQNTQKAQVSFLGWSGQAPLSATLIIAAAAGALIVAAAGALRILQLRRRVKRELKSR